MAEAKNIQVKGKCCSMWLALCIYLYLVCCILAVMDYADYQRRVAKKTENKKETLLQNPTPEIIPDAMSDADILQEQVAVNNANKDFNVDTNQTDQTVEVVPKTNLNSDTTPLPIVTEPSLLDKVPESDQKKAKVLLENLGLDCYTGGVFTLDSEQYSKEELVHLMELLYGKKKNVDNMKVGGKDFMFIKSLHERNLKKYVKNKLLFGLVKGPEWWNLNV